MKVFISWSGDRSQAVAAALRDWFPLVLHYIDPWLSKSDIQAGERWSVEIAKELEACNFGIICVTKDNLNAPWILFEAGALAKSMENGRVIPLLLDVDVKEVTGPLAQFQAAKLDSAGVLNLILGLNKASSGPVPDQKIDKLFSALWADLEKQLAMVPKSATPTRQSRPQGEILEELVAGVRNVESRVRDIVDEDSFFRKRRKRHRVHPGMILDMSRQLSFRSRDPIQIMMLATLVRDEIPWLYELALEFFRTRRISHGRFNDYARKQLQEALQMLERGPYAEEIGVDPFILHAMRKELKAFAPTPRIPASEIPDQQAMVEDIDPSTI